MLSSARSKNLFVDLAVLLAGISVPLAFAPFDLGYLIYPALIILLSAWQFSSPGRAFRRGYLFGFGLFGFGVDWLHISINLFGGVSLALALAATYLLVAFLALYPALSGWLLRRYFSTSPALALIIAVPALWTLSEWLRSWLFTGFPWLNLGYSQIDTPLAAFMPLAGVYAVSWLVVLLSGLLTAVLWLSSWRQRGGAIIGIILIALSALGLKQQTWTQPTSRPLQAVLVQGAVAQAIKWEPEQLQQTMHLYHDLTEDYWQQADVIVWPETAIPALSYRLEDFLAVLREQSLSAETPLVLGLATFDRERQKFYNSILSIGVNEDIYHKRHLVPFGEYLPLKPLLDPFLSFLQIPMSDFSSGDADKPLLKLGSITAGVSICYEDIFGEEVIEALPEAEVLINISNDAWFGDSIAAHQHLQMARARALETGRYMLRATNTGISAVINPQGKVTARSPQFEADVLVAEMRLFSGLTPYGRVGNSLIIVFSLLCLIAIGYYNRYSHNLERQT